MAPNKKKKKTLASNPARGFATTSTPAKSKVDEKFDDCEAPETTLTDSNVVTKIENVGSNVASNTTDDLSKLNSEELENHLEESALQILVEKHGEKSKKDASRHANKLRTEQRVLRLQSERLDISSWLPQELVQMIFELLESQMRSPAYLDANVRQQRYNITEEHLIVRLWTLQQVLTQLGFTKDRVQLAILPLLKTGNLTESASSASKDGLWGLDETLDFLAQICEPEEMPSYDVQTASNQANKSRKILRNAVVSDSARKSNSVRTPKLSDDGADSDSGQEPDRLVAKYLSVQSEIYQIEPGIFKPGNRALENRKAIEGNPDIARLLAKINRIESDILFDRDEARSKWMEMEKNLAKEAAERKRFQLDRDPKVKTKTVAVPPSKSTEALQAEEDEDLVDMVGELFSSLPETYTNAKTGKTQLTNTTTEGETMIIRDFGMWTGANPRRILEDACKARHSLLIEWSRTQDVPFSTYPWVSLEAACDFVKIEMKLVSTPSSSQSESYVSTAALFSIFASFPKEQKVYFRLPPPWRDLWTEMSEFRRQQSDADDRNDLRELQSMVSEVDSSDQRSISIPNNGSEIVRVRKEEMDEALTEELNLSLPPQGIARIWSLKVSTPQYQAMLESRMKLPIWNFKETLLKSIVDHQVVIVCGETGCGKSTQVPAFIIEHELSKGRDCKVYCTEPRRISAISLARRVSEELGERKTDVGTSNSLVGFAIRLESKVASQTKLVYATTGIVMRMLERSEDLTEVTHLIIDEVHERTLEGDFLLIVLRKLLSRRPTLRVVLMSATVNALKFSNYLSQAPILNVPGRTYPVETKFIEDVIEKLHLDDNEVLNKVSHGDGFDFDEDTLGDSGRKNTFTDSLQNYSAKTRRTLAELDEYQISYNLIVQLLATIATSDTYVSYSKAILVFLPGIAEIRRLHNMLLSHRSFSQGWYIYQLHSTIATEEQEQAFLVPPPGTRKIVLATNIAETGITIPDVTCVVDTGKHKELRFDERRQLSKLIESFISRANAKQRRGRAGRVQNGLCFHLFTKARHDNLMLEEQTPEMLRLSLQDLVLRVKICKLGDIEQTLSEALDPPSSKNIRRAVDSLIDVKALTPGEELTPLGMQLSRLPLDIFLGKLILLGTIYQCLDAALSIAAILSSKSPFSAPLGARSQAELARMAFKKGDSDLLTVYNAYCAWRRVCINGGSEVQFCSKNFLSQQTLSNIEDLKAQLTTSLIDAGFIALSDPEKASLNRFVSYRLPLLKILKNRRARFYSMKRRHFFEIPGRYDLNSCNDRIMNSLIAWSFYPKLLVRDGKGWKNVANNQFVSLYPTSVNKGISQPPKWLSFYHIMQSSNKFYNAHETSGVEDFAIALACGDAEFKMYAGVIIIDGNRIRFSVDSWRAMLAIKSLRAHLRQIMTQSFRRPGRELSSDQRAWLDIWGKLFSQDAS
ncbi:hypothetical protein MMC07_005173 [Pseudocyphellaria aurata]|nr:hypothetical protein [Pseudocyphellaria aurata]